MREDELLEKYNLAKFDVAHIIAMVLHVVTPKEAIEEQGRGISSIFKAFDSKTQILIEIPIASCNVEQSQVQSLQTSTALVCLIKQIYGQGHSLIKKQAQMIQSKFEQYSQSTYDLAKFKREALAEITVHDSLWRYYSKLSNKRDTNRDFCEDLLKKVAFHDRLWMKNILKFHYSVSRSLCLSCFTVEILCGLYDIASSLLSLYRYFVRTIRPRICSLSSCHFLRVFSAASVAC